MLKTKAIFERKGECFRPKNCVIEKVIALSGYEYDSFAARRHLDYDFIRDNIGLMRSDDRNNTYHCLLVIGEGREHGILIQSEGYDYARYAALMPHAASILTVHKGGKALAELNNELVGIVDKIVDEALHCPIGERCVEVDMHDMEEKYGINIERNTAIVNTILGMLDERPEVQDWEWDTNSLLITLDVNFMTYRATDVQPNTEQGEGSLQTQEMSLTRKAELLDKALDVVGNQFIRQGLYDVLSDDLGMSDEEITASGFELSDYFPITEEENPAQTMSI